MRKSIVFIVILALLGKYLKDIGVFRRIETKGLDKCRLIVPSDGDDQAFEDLTIDYEKGLAYMAGDERSWLHTFSIPIANRNKQGRVFTFDIQSETFQKFDLINYPYEHFHPLGVGLLKRKNNQLFMTNHRIVNEEIIGAVEIFEIDSSNNKQLKWIDSVVHPLFTMPDDVLAIDEKTFYVTNIYHHRTDKSHLMHTFEVFTKRPWTEIILCSKTNEWHCSIVVDSMVTANGIAASRDLKTIYVAETVLKRIRIFKRHAEDNSLTDVQSLPVPFFVDNVHVDEDNQLIAAGHPKPLLFMLHEKDHRNHRAPSEVVIFRHPTSNSTFENLFLSNGEILSASTVGATYKEKLLIGGLCDPGILLCQDLL